MSFEQLPAELIARIIFLLEQPPPEHFDFNVPPPPTPAEDKLSFYASVSPIFQRVIEQRSFTQLRLNKPGDLEKFEESVARSTHSHRRAALRRIHFSASLPEYDDAACARFERGEERKNNNFAFNDAIVNLFAALKACDDVEQPTPISLFIESPSSPMDFQNRSHEKQNHDKEQAMLARGRPDIFEHRYEHSYVSISPRAQLDQPTRVNTLVVTGDQPRYLDPRSAVIMASNLPKLEKIDWKLSDSEKKKPLLRTQLRHDFAQALTDFNCPQLREFSFGYQHNSPANDNFKNANVKDADEDGDDDVLCASLHNLVQRLSLPKVHIEGPICLDESFFYPYNVQTDKDPPIWPTTEEAYITFSMVRPDGGWYFERDPEASPDGTEYGTEDETRTPEFSDEDSEDEDSDDMDEDSPDTFNEQKEKYLSGLVPVRPFRCIPNASLEPVLEAAARQIARMPKLKCMSLSAPVSHCKRTRDGDGLFEMVYAAKGEEMSDLDQDPGDVVVPRLYWVSPRGWRMSEKLEELWRGFLGKDGIVRYQEW